MDNSIRVLHASNLICVGIDQNRYGEYSGKIWHQYQDAPVRYQGTLEMIRAVETLLDEWGSPRQTTEYRSFIKRDNRRKTEIEKIRQRKEKRKGEQSDMDQKRIQMKNGKNGTFMIQVKYRQNASWQGEVTWIEMKKKQSFRSALELLKIMDEALEAGTDETEEAATGTGE